MTSQAVPQDNSSTEGQIKQLRLRKVYMRLRIPRVKEEIATLASRKKTLSNGSGEANKEVVEELIYANQHLLVLRKELAALEEERKAVLENLRAFKQQGMGMPLPHG